MESHFQPLVNQTCLEDFRVVCINDGTIGLLEIANEVLKHPDLHLEPRFDFIVLHHLVEGRNNLVDLAVLREMKRRRGRARFRDRKRQEERSALSTILGQSRALERLPVDLDLCVPRDRLVRMVKLWDLDVIAAGRLVFVDGHSGLAPPI